MKRRQIQATAARMKERGLRELITLMVTRINLACRLVPGLHGSAGFCSNGDGGVDVPLDAPPLGLSCADLGSPQRMGKRRGRSGWGSAGVRRIGKCSGGFGEAAAGFGEVAAGSTNSDGSRRGRRMGKKTDEDIAGMNAPSLPLSGCGSSYRTASISIHCEIGTTTRHFICGPHYRTILGATHCGRSYYLHHRRILSDGRFLFFFNYCKISHYTYLDYHSMVIHLYR